MRDLTVIYYTAQSELPAFELNVRRLLQESCGDTPIICVSQKPIYPDDGSVTFDECGFRHQDGSFGHNICVGEVGRSGQNIFRQMQIGAMYAKTKYVCTAESDEIYPPEYFEVVPPRDDIAYFIMPLYVCFVQRRYAKYYAPKYRGSESAMVINRELLVKSLEKMLDGWGMWGANDSNGSSFWYLTGRRGLIGREYITISNPMVTFKTDQNLHRRTPHDAEHKTREIPYWGECHELIDRLRQPVEEKVLNGH